MARKKPEDRIRELARLPENSRCFDCGRMGAQNTVCLTYNIFVCTSCGGLHRTFDHIVKSINMSMFTPAEVDGLKHGGNAVAAQLILARFDPAQTHVDPDSASSILAFMKSAYVDKLWYREEHGHQVREQKKEPHRITSYFLGA